MPTLKTRAVQEHGLFGWGHPFTFNRSKAGPGQAQRIQLRPNARQPLRRAVKVDHPGVQAAHTGIVKPQRRPLANIRGMTQARFLLSSSALIGWGLAVAAIAIGYTQYGWAGVFLAFTMIVFWLLLQFSRALRVMRAAATNPVASVDSALMAHIRIERGMKMLAVLRQTKSLGKRLPHPSPGVQESWEWHDQGGDALVVDFVRGRCVGASLVRAPTSGAQAPDAPPSPALPPA